MKINQPLRFLDETKTEIINNWAEGISKKAPEFAEAPPKPLPRLLGEFFDEILMYLAKEKGGPLPIYHLKSTFSSWKEDFKLLLLFFQSGEDAFRNQIKNNASQLSEEEKTQLIQKIHKIFLAEIQREKSWNYLNQQSGFKGQHYRNINHDRNFDRTHRQEDLSLIA